jgi:hypothetical protein
MSWKLTTLLKKKHCIWPLMAFYKLNMTLEIRLANAGLDNVGSLTSHNPYSPSWPVTGIALLFFIINVVLTCYGVA